MLYNKVGGKGKGPWGAYSERGAYSRIYSIC